MDTTFNYVAQPEIEILKSISDSAGLSIQEGYVPERGQVWGIWCKPTVLMMVSISKYFSEHKHVKVQFIILVLKNSAFTTQAYYYLS